MRIGWLPLVYVCRSVKWPQMVKRYIEYIGAFTDQMIHAFRRIGLIKRNHLRTAPLGPTRGHRDSRVHLAIKMYKLTILYYCFFLEKKNASIGIIIN